LDTVKNISVNILLILHNHKHRLQNNLLCEGRLITISWARVRTQIKGFVIFVPDHDI